MSSNTLLVAKGGPYLKKNNGNIMRCRKYVKSGHVRYQCLWMKQCQEKALSQMLAISQLLREMIKDEYCWLEG